MKGVTALTKINKRTKALKKKHPGKKYSTLRAQAAREYNTGKLPKARKKAAPKKKRRRKAVSKVGAKHKVYHEVKKVGKVRRKRKAATPKKAKRVYKPRRVSVRAYKATRYRRVGASSKSIMPLVAIAGLGVLAYFMLKPKPATQLVTVPGSSTPLALNGNPARDTSAQNILAYAQAAGIGITALTALINSLNSMSDSAVVDVAKKQQSGMDINTLLALPTGGPSIQLG